MSRLHTTPRHGRLLTLALVVVVAACSLGQSQDLVWRDGRLKARPRTVSGMPVSGFVQLGIGRERDGLLYVPRAAAKGPVPLVVMLHGAGGSAQGIRRRLFGTSDSLEFALLIPDSRGPTWDAIRGIYGPDIAFMDSALRIVFSRVSIDPSRVIVSGFSDGASYALAVGRMNGDLFTRIVAFSPGFIPPSTAAGKPEVYITHGNNDPILPFEDTSERIAPMLSRAGYAVTLKTFVGGHTVPPDLMHEAFAWALASRVAPKPK